ncbi:nitroreductase family deazaflavin-dependent oxidoreductase [Mycobacterium sp. Y57]|uniref:nitroreductase family deazaflavin-dependent oxidoreductase n=1 Tax=Mycolicibacterium xanthum TaxID=2796469 RepID=UPI001C848DF6|nr:nitroreductase family deazaflavin-dependent oxidoreductase [Mycolicibacterium xanthum]MBX7434209.1 nitroreductase family deazaflavin-dependent oxidoreductase [Mycolicibacterium xanthum]
MGGRGGFGRWYWVKRRLYPGRRPGPAARVLNAFWARQYAAGRLARDRDVTLEVRGRVSGDTVAVPVVMADLAGQWYLVSMLGGDARWVSNVRAAGGRATIRHGRGYPVALQEVAIADRAPVLRRYIDVAPGARPHVPVPRQAPLAEFEAIAADFPVFRIGWISGRPEALR